MYKSVIKSVPELMSHPVFVYVCELMYDFEPGSEPDGAKIHSQDARLMCSGQVTPDT